MKQHLQRFIYFTLTVMVLATAGKPSAALAQRAGVGSTVPSQRMLRRFGLERAWWGQATLNPSRDRVLFITLDEENLYVQSTGSIITAFDNETGKRLWAVQLGRRDSPSFPAVSNQNFVLVVAGLKLYSLAKFSGEVLWEINLPKQPSTRPETDDNQVYVGSLDGSVFAFDLRKIHELYNDNLLPQWSGETVNWRYKTSKEVSTPPVSNGRIVNFASRDGSLYSVSTRERDLSWQFETDAPISAPLGQANGFLYLASEDFNVYCINGQNGQVRWQFISGFPVRKQPIVIGSDVYIAPDRGGMFALGTRSGTQKWWRPTPSQFLAAARNRLFVSDRVGNVLVLSRDEGALLGTIPLRHFSARFSNDRTDRLYLATQSGLVVCIRDRGQEFPTFHKYPERLPIMPEFAPEKPETSETPKPADSPKAEE